jgi:hypothetical protein
MGQMRWLGAIVLGVALMVSLQGGCGGEASHIKPPPHIEPPHIDPPPLHPDRPPLPERDEPPPPVAVPLSSTGEQAVHAGEADGTEREIICFAYEEFYDPATGELRLPSAVTFTGDVFEKVRPRSEEEQLVGKAFRVYGLVRSLSAGEFVAVAEELACS